MEGQKIITPSALVRQECFLSESVGEDLSLKDYLQFLEKKGVQLNPKVFPSKFRLKNGLEYLGMAAREEVGSNEVLIRVPEELILSADKAVAQDALREVYLDPFFIAKFEFWQDRALIVYCMFILDNKDQSCVWYQMVNRFPKECDLLCFWEPEQLQGFKDPTIQSAVQLDIKSFEQQFAQFQECQSRHTILQTKSFTLQNYKKIFTHLSNRSFASAIKFTSFVPFAELFNHHCSTTFYQTQKQRQVYFKDAKTDEDDEESSNGSQESNQYLQIGQFAYDQIQVTPYIWGTKEDSELKHNQKAIIIKLVENLLHRIDVQLNWADFSILFVGFLIQKIKVVQNQYIAGRKIFEKTQNQLAIIERSFLKYKEWLTEYYKTVKDECEKKAPKPVIPQQKIEYPRHQKPYESLIIKTGRTDRFQTNNQIFFRYGRKSNRQLLLRYGFAIQGNKYEHVWINFNVVQCIKDFPDVLDKLMEKNLSLLRKFKIKYHQLNMDIIIFFRLNNWAFYNEKSVEQIYKVANVMRQIAIIEQIISIMTDNIQTYEGEYDLSNKALSYHGYFREVYNSEKYKILKRQKQMLETILLFLERLKEGKTKAELMQKIDPTEKYLLRHYLMGID